MSYNPVFNPALPAEKPLILSAELREALDALTVEGNAFTPTVIQNPMHVTRKPKQGDDLNQPVIASEP